MNRALAATAPTAALATSNLATEGVNSIVVGVNQWKRLNLPRAVAAGVCDDPTVVRTEARDGARHSGAQSWPYNVRLLGGCGRASLVVRRRRCAEFVTVSRSVR